MYFPLRNIVTSVAVALILAGTTVAQDDDDSSNSLNVCITPRSCFINKTSPGVEYCVTTPWHLHYPKQIRSKIQDPVRNPNYTIMTDVYNCGWSYGYDVSRISVYRGSIWYRAPANGSWNYPPTLWTDTQGAFSALHDSYPGVEIALILILTIGLPFVLLFLFGVFMCILGTIRLFRHVRKSLAERRQQRAELKAEKRLQQEAEKTRERERRSEDTLAWNGTEKMPASSNGSMV